MVNPMGFTVSQLKNKMQKRNLSTSGIETELILKVNIEYPQDTWINKEITRKNREWNGAANLQELNRLRKENASLTRALSARQNGNNGNQE